MSFFLQSADWIDMVGVIFDQGVSFVWVMEGTELHIITSTSDGTHLGFAPAGSCLGGLAPDRYEVILYYLSLPDEEMAVERVQLRVAQGGHNVLVDVIKRRYHRGWKNFLDYYKDLVDTWVIFDNSGISPVIIEEKP